MGASESPLCPVEGRVFRFDEAVVPGIPEVQGADYREDGVGRQLWRGGELAARVVPQPRGHGFFGLLRSEARGERLAVEGLDRLGERVFDGRLQDICPHRRPDRIGVGLIGFDAGDGFDIAGACVQNASKGLCACGLPVQGGIDLGEGLARGATRKNLECEGKACGRDDEARTGVLPAVEHPCREAVEPGSERVGGCVGHGFSFPYGWTNDMGRDGHYFGPNIVRAMGCESWCFSARDWLMAN